MKYELLTNNEVAKRLGLKPDSLRRLRVRGSFIEPDGYLGVSPYWSSVRVAEWAAARPKRGRPIKKAS